MVRMANNLIAAMHMGERGAREPKSALVNELISHGYGEEKAIKWIETFIKTGDVYLVACDAELGRELYTTKWWTPIQMPPRRRISRPRINADALTEEELEIIGEASR